MVERRRYAAVRVFLQLCAMALSLIVLKISALYSVSKSLSASEVLLLSRKIRRCGKNVSECLNLLTTLAHTERKELYESAYLEALGVVSQAQKQRQRPDQSQSYASERMNKQRFLLQTTLQLYDQCPTEPCRARAISICGHDKVGYPIALDLLRRQYSSPASIQSYNAALAACATAKDWKEAKYILFHEMSALNNSALSTLSCNIVLTAMERAKQGSEALRLLKTMMMDWQFENGFLPLPDRSSFHHTMAALIGDDSTISSNSSKHSNVDSAYNLLNEMVRMDNSYTKKNAGTPRIHTNVSVRPNNTTFDLLVSAYGRIGNWDAVHLVESLRYLQPANETIYYPDPSCTIPRVRRENVQSPLLLRWDNDSRGMVKEGKGKWAYWGFATYVDSSCGLNLTVALQPHRNPSKNGIKILLLDNRPNRKESSKDKIGFLLMINDPCDTSAGTSRMLGLYLDKGRRKQGLSKILIAIWLDLCLRAEIIPKTGVIHKPLLALVLQYTFGFDPETNDFSVVGTLKKQSGVMVEVSPGIDGDTVELFAPSLKSLQGAFAAWDLKREQIRLVSEAPWPRGRNCCIGTAFAVRAGSGDDLHAAVKNQLTGKSGEGNLVFNSKETHWRNIFFGNRA